MENENAALQGVKVLDFTWVVAGPLVTKFLADHGAQVVKIEWRGHPDLMRLSSPYKGDKVDVNRGGAFVAFNSSKYSLTLNLNLPGARDVAKKLTTWAEVVVENFEPGTMEKWGLGYNDLKEIKPDVIMLSISNLGQTGVESRVTGAGLQTAAMGGFHHLSGWPDGDPTCPAVAYPDYVTASFGAMAVILALEHRRKTGRGQYIDLSMLECSTHFLASAMLQYVFNGVVEARQGNRCDYAAPHGVYRCKGEDRWCAITVFNDEEWQGFGEALGSPLWVGHEQFATLLARKANEDELDRLVQEWTLQRTPEEVMQIMQRHGVPASIVEDGEDLVDKDPQIRERRFFIPLQHPEMGLVLHRAWPAKLSRTPYHLRRAPLFGEHNEFVLTEILGLSTDQVAELLVDGVLE